MSVIATYGVSSWPRPPNVPFDVYPVGLLIVVPLISNQTAPSIAEVQDPCAVSESHSDVAPIIARHSTAAALRTHELILILHVRT